MKTKRLKFYAAGVACVFSLITVLALWGGLVGHNDDQNWQVLQSVSGNVSIIDEPGYYYKGFGSVWTYPRTLEGVYSAHIDEGGEKDTSIQVTFNDAGTAAVSSYTKVQLPVTAEQRRKLHQDFAGNRDNILDALRAHLVNCIKASGPVMSASENQASRKAEFNLIVEEQLAKGLFKMRRTEIELNDLTEIVDGGVDQNGKPIIREKKAVVQATQIVKDSDGVPIVIQTSPLKAYGINIMQFSITEILYDDQTLEQFSAKKASYLNAEKSKAQRQEEVQSRLMIEERGRRQVAEIEAEENQKKERALIQAAQKEEVAEIEKRQAVIEAEKKVEVAQQSKAEAVTLNEIAAIKASTAELDKKAVISAAEARQQELELGGGLSEEKRILAEIKAKRDVDVAAALANVKTPGVVMVGGQGGGGGNLMENLVNMWLLKANGILPATTPVAAK